MFLVYTCHCKVCEPADAAATPHGVRTGKSHTMEGTDTDPGIIPFSFRHIFEKIGLASSTSPVRVGALSSCTAHCRACVVLPLRLVQLLPL